PDVCIAAQRRIGDTDDRMGTHPYSQLLQKQASGQYRISPTGPIPISIWPGSTAANTPIYGLRRTFNQESLRCFAIPKHVLRSRRSMTTFTQVGPVVGFVPIRLHFIVKCSGCPSVMWAAFLMGVCCVTVQEHIG